MASKKIAVEVRVRERRLRELAFEKDIVTVGRDPASDVHLDDAGVSRHHAQLERRSGQVHVRECGSTNGTLLNAMHVHDARIAPGDVLRIGKFELFVTQRDEVVPSAPAPSARRGPDLETIQGVRRGTRVAEEVPSAPRSARRSYVGWVVAALGALAIAVAWVAG